MDRREALEASLGMISQDKSLYPRGAFCYAYPGYIPDFELMLRNVSKCVFIVKISVGKPDFLQLSLFGIYCAFANKLLCE